MGGEESSSLLQPLARGRKKGAASLCWPWSNEQGARARRRTGRALGWRLKTTEKRCSQGETPWEREVDELLLAMEERGSAMGAWSSAPCCRAPGIHGEKRGCCPARGRWSSGRRAAGGESSRPWGRRARAPCLLPWGEQRGGRRGGEEGCWWRLEICEGWECKITKCKERGLLFIGMR
jgi:hypothetical protein